MVSYDFRCRPRQSTLCNPKIIAMHYDCYSLTPSDWDVYYHVYLSHRKSDMKLDAKEIAKRMAGVLNSYRSVLV